MSGKGVSKVHYIILLILTFIPLIMTLIAFPFLPDPLPAHFSAGGNVNRWGSVYEALLLPVITLVTGLALIWATKYSGKKDDYAGRMMLFVTLITLIVFIVITAILLYVWMTYTG
jgi:hypothetical protein